MRREVVVQVWICDWCGKGQNPLDLTPLGPLDGCFDCATLGACQSCGGLPYFPHGQSALWGGNCIGCLRRAFDLPRGKCGATAPVWLGLCAIGFPKGRHACRNIPGHSGGHECLCGATWL